MKKQPILPCLEWPDKSMSPEPPESIPTHLHDTIYAHPLWDNSLGLEATECQHRREAIPANRLLWGDNLSFLQSLILEGYENRVHLIYVDPPYFSQTNYESTITTGSGENVKREAFDDRWSGKITDYLNMLYPRFELMQKILRNDGSIFVHVDWHCSHYVRLMLDEIFGRNHFINEIVWCYGGGGSSQKHFMRKHDLIYWYGKSETYTYNPQYRPYTAGTLQRGLTQVKGDQYKLRSEGASMQDWWTDIPKILSPTARENLKYPTQKPEELISRIIQAATHPGDLVADFFAGSGTVAEICNQLGRNWILCDDGKLACHTMLYRLIRSQSMPFTLQTLTPIEDQQKLIIEKESEIQPDGSVVLHLSIESYLPTGKKQILQGLELAEYIEFWEIDLHHDGRIFISDYQMIREKHRFNGRLPMDLMVHLPRQNSHCAAIRVHDIRAVEATEAFYI